MNAPEYNNMVNTASKQNAKVVGIFSRHALTNPWIYLLGQQKLSSHKFQINESPEKTQGLILLSDSPQNPLRKASFPSKYKTS